MNVLLPQFDMRAYTGSKGNQHPVGPDDFELCHILSKNFDLYDGEPISQPQKKDNGVHMLARHAGCHCPGTGVCREQRAARLATCKTLAGKWHYPPVADTAAQARLEKEFARGEGEELSDSDDEFMSMADRRVLAEREAAEDETAISHIAPNEERRVAAANAASHRAQIQAAPLAIAAGTI